MDPPDTVSNLSFRTARGSGLPFARECLDAAPRRDGWILPIGLSLRVRGLWLLRAAPRSHQLGRWFTPCANPRAITT
jgi:hypothetical protein